MKTLKEPVSSYIIKVVAYYISLAIVNCLAMIVWNLVIPEIFGLKSISYFQMLGLYFICDFLFKWKFNLNSSDKVNK